MANSSSSSPVPKPANPSSPPNTDEPINLLRGWPSPSLLPPKLLLNAAQKALSDPSISTPGLSYGPDEGYLPLREALAGYLSTFYSNRRKSTSGSGAESQGAITSDRITITGGASQNLACLLAAFTDPSYTRKVFVSEPAYFLAFPIFEDAGFSASSGDRMLGVREDDEGVDLVALEKGLEESERDVNEQRRKGRGDEWQVPRYKFGFEKIYKYIIYCVPAFSNPSGRTMSLRRREELVRLARKYDALVVCDDVYDFLQWRVDEHGQEQRHNNNNHDDDSQLQKALLPRVIDIDRTLSGGALRADADGFGNVASNGSFSKILGPGLRVGWCEGAPKLAYGVSQTGATRSGGAPSQLTSTYIVPLIESGDLQRHIDCTLRPAYARRYRRLRGAVERYLEPLGFKVLSPTTVVKHPPHLHSAADATGVNYDKENLGPSTGDDGADDGDDDGDGDGDGVAGGFFIWLSLPPALLHRTTTKGRGGTGAKEFAARCLKEGRVVISPGVNFEVPSSPPVATSEEGAEAGGSGEQGGSKNKMHTKYGSRSRFEAEFRLCFAYVDEDDLEEGVRRMGVVAAKMLDEKDSSHAGAEVEDEDEGYVIINRPDEFPDASDGAEKRSHSNTEFK